jgi:signal transduction histidine kinase
MKITTRIFLGYALFIAILVGLVVYQVITINRMQSINRALSDINFKHALACLQALRDRDLVEEYAWKSFALADPDYLNQLQEFQKSFEASLMEIRKYSKSDAELSEINRLSQMWDAFAVDLEFWQKDLPQSGTTLPQILQNHLEQLRIQISSTYQSSMNSMSLKVDNSRKTGETAEIVLWCIAFAAIAVSVLVSFLIYRSISKPLAHLTEGTRAIADGKFFYRLDASRRDEFSQLARDFNTMTQRLNELDQLKKGFVTHVSHELKAPLASMRETIQLLLEGIPGPLTEKQKRLLELSLQSGKRLTSMIGNLLDLSKTDAGVMEYQLKNQDLIPLVHSAIAELEVQAQEKQVRIDPFFPESSLPVVCDSDRIVQVIVNLVSNAVKFSPKNATVHVSVDEISDIPKNIPLRWRSLLPDSRREGGFGLVTIVDSGPGIPDKDKEKIFERFHQIKQEEKKAGQGVGLGLAICRIIVQAHRGAVWVEDNPGGGSRFRLLLRSGGDVGRGVPRASQPL